MDNKNFRTLYADEIDVRVGQCKETGCSLLLYQSSRAAMNLLDEVVGSMNWCREHTFKDGKLYCKVGIWDENKKQFVYKEDVGVESNSDAEKGQSSDSFKRAAVNWGIGRELYSAPFIWVSLDKSEVITKTYNQKTSYQLSPAIKFEVSEIAYDDKRNISKLVIKDNKGAVRFTYPSRGGKSATAPKQETKPTTAIPPKAPEQAPQKPAILTREELSLIRKDEFLTSKMLEACGGFKWNDLPEGAQTTITVFMRQFIERGMQ